MSEHMKPKTIIFDLYGTLIDIRTDEQQPQVWDKLARFLRYRGLSADAGTLYHTFFDRMQKTLDDSQETYPEVDVLGIFHTLLDDLAYQGPDDFAVQIAQLFRILSIEHFGLFPEVLPVLQELRGLFKLGLLSNAQAIFLRPEIRITELDQLWGVIIISSDYGFQKPDSRLFAKALARLDSSAEEAIYVGDSVRHDICGAQAAGMRGVLIDRQGNAEGPCQANLRFRSLEDLGAWLVN